jgi:hypothetical protein
LEVANKLSKTSSALGYGRGESAIKLAVKKELPVFGVETYDVGR